MRVAEGKIARVVCLPICQTFCPPSYQNYQKESVSWNRGVESSAVGGGGGEVGGEGGGVNEELGGRYEVGGEGGGVNGELGGRDEVIGSVAVEAGAWTLDKSQGRSRGGTDA